MHVLLAAVHTGGAFIYDTILTWHHRKKKKKHTVTHFHVLVVVLSPQYILPGRRVHRRHGKVDIGIIWRIREHN